MSNDASIFWKPSNSRRHQTPVLVGREIRADWIGRDHAEVYEVSLGGDLLRVLNRLDEAARERKRSLPIVALRLSLSHSVSSLVFLDRSLGTRIDERGKVPPALEVLANEIVDEADLRERVTHCFERWVMDHLLSWCKHHELDELAGELPVNISPAEFLISAQKRPYVRDGRPSFDLVARRLGDQLAGEELFEGLGPCELIVQADRPGSNRVSLMTYPRRLSDRHQGVFSMVAHLSVVSLPYQDGLFLRFGATKRNWTSRMPAAGFSATGQVSGYVMHTNHPAIPVPVVRGEDGWAFHADYQALLHASQGALPADLETALAQREFDRETGWWVGLPENPVLQSYVAQRTVFEADEIALAERASELLSPLIDTHAIRVKTHKLPRRAAPSNQTMVKLDDIGAAGAVFDTSDAEPDGATEPTDDAARQRKLDGYREQNRKAIQSIHPEKTPLIVMFGGNEEEQRLAEQTIELLFDDAISFMKEPLPTGAHGVRAELDQPKAKGRVRFEARVERWQTVASKIEEIAATRPVIALICAAKEIGKQHEDPVNYYAGIHALARAGANVHHVLPMGGDGDAGTRQHFVHRLQSALLDVIFAHSGKTLGVDTFIERVLPQGHRPKGVYGIQAIRSRKDYLSGQADVCLLLYSRMDAQTGIAAVRVGYRQNGQDGLTGWMDLAQGLRWLATQRNLQEGDDRWLKGAFAATTKRVLSEIHAEDPHAVVMVDWQRVRSMWPELSDRKINAGGGPAIDQAALSVFETMTIMRIRRGGDTLALRTESRQHFRAIQEGDEPKTSGEDLVHSYASTTRMLASIPDRSPDTAGHFFVSMGYSKQSQVPRGLSCFRPVTRMNQIQGQQYVLETLNPATKDASISATMEVTVLQAPKGVPPEDYAKLVMGLRVGFAHYDSWTGNPMPLFFANKVEDYIIRYPESAAAASVASGEDAPAAVPADDLTQAVVETIAGNTQNAQANAEDVAHARGGEGSQSDPAAEATRLPGRDVECPEDLGILDSAQLLELAKDIHIPRIARQPGRAGEAFRESMRSGIARNPRIPILVDLPSFVDPKTLFRVHSKLSKSSVRSSFQWLRTLGYAKENTARPTQQQYLPVLSRTLRIPQTMSVLISALRYIGLVSLRPVAEIINDEINPKFDDETQIRPELIELDEVPLLWRHAQDPERPNDALTAWLVFIAAQLPNSNWSTALHDHLTHVPGPMTREAICYYISTGRAVARVLECADRKQPIVDIHERLPEIEAMAETVTHTRSPSTEAVETPEKYTATSSEARSGAAAGSNGRASATLSATPSRPDGGTGQVGGDDGPERTAQVESDSNANAGKFSEESAALARQFDRIEPGAEDFDARIEAFQADAEQALERLRAAHAEQLEAARQEREAELAHADRQARIAACEEALGECHERLVPMLAEAGVPEVTPAAVSDENVEIIEGEIEALAPSVDALATALEALNAHASAEVPKGIQARRQHNDRERECLDGIAQAAEALHEALGQSHAFLIDAHSPAEPSESTGESDSQAPAALPKAEVGAGIEGDAPIPAQPEVHDAPVANPSDQAPVSDSTQAPAKTGSKEVDQALEASDAPAMSATTDTSAQAAEEVPGNEAVADEHAVSEPNEEVADDEGSQEVIDEAAGVLNTLLDRRLFGLARTQVSAIGAVAEDPATTRHHLILDALTRTLTDMDVHQIFTSRLPDGYVEKVLLDEYLCRYDETDAPAIAMGVLAAGIGHMLFDQDGDLAWQITNATEGRLSGHPAVAGLVSHIDAARKRGIILTRDLFLRSRIGDKEAMRRELTRMQDRAEKWALAPEINSTFNHAGFRSLHKALFAPEHPIGRCLAAVAAGDAKQAARAHEQALRKFLKPKDTINETFKQLGERSKLEGLYRNQVVENIKTTDQFVRDYLELANRLDAEKSEIPANTQHFLDTLNRHLNEAIEAAQAVPVESALEALYRDALTMACRHVVRLFDPEAGEPCLPIDQQQLLITLPMDRNLIPSVEPIDEYTPPLCTPPEVFRQTRQLLDDVFAETVPTQETLDEALQAAMNDHRLSKRFLPYHLIEQVLGRKPSTANKSKGLARGHKDALNELIEDLQKARQRVTHAMTLSALEDAQGEQDAKSSQMEQLIVDMLTRCQNAPYIGTPQGADHIYPDFPQAKAALRHHVTQPLEKELTGARDKLRDKLEEMDASGDYRKQDLARILAMLDSDTPDAASLRTAFDAINMLEKSGEMPSRIEADELLADPFDQLIEAIKHQPGNKRLLPSLLDQLGAEPDPENEPEWLAGLDTDARGEARHIIETWLAFFKTRSGAPEQLEGVLKALGLTTSASPLNSASRKDKYRFALDTTIFRLASGDDQPLFVPPALGSDATSIEAYVAFNHMGDTDFLKILPEINDTPTLMLARSELNMAQRAKQTANTPLILIDDALVAFMALHPDRRLEMMVRVGMLTFGANPYDDYNTRPVATEMFFGRQNELDRLRGVSSLAVLYGGRRLGKSSLLHQIDQELKERGTEHSVFLSMTTDLQDENFAVIAWNTVLSKLVHAGLADAPKEPLSEPSQLISHIEQSLLANDVKRIYLLLDECDEVIGCELRQEGRASASFIQGLSHLAANLDTHGVFLRAIIAGLHNATRLMSTPNSAFGKMEAIALTPFSSAEDMQMGMRLITKPLAALGYTFEKGSEDLPLRILSICNAYPALIQIYCKALVRRMQNRRQHQRPPIAIHEDDLDAVEQDEALLFELQSKFKLNLDLDKRYMAIGLILADSYYSESVEGSFEGLEVQEIREYCETYVPEHFEGARLGLYEALLDEMCQLNILKKNAGRYSMRNPHIAMMLGNRDRITSLISDLAKEPPEGQQNHGERRIAISQGNKLFLFPMPVAWVRNHLTPLAGHQSELLILTGNAVSGITHFNQALGDREPLYLPEGEFVPLPGNRPEQVKPQLRKKASAKANAGLLRTMVLRNEAWRTDDIPEYAAMAKSAASQGIRLMLVAHPEKALDIADAIHEGRIRRGQNWRVVGIPPWGVDAVAHLLREENPALAENRAVLEAIVEATSGFGRDIQILCNRQLNEASALEAPQRLAEKYASDFDAYLQHIHIPPRLGNRHGSAIQELLTIIDGESRHDEELLSETLAACGLSQEAFDYLQWMGVVQAGPRQTWTYASLLRQVIS